MFTFIYLRVVNSEPGVDLNKKITYTTELLKKLMLEQQKQTSYYRAVEKAYNGTEINNILPGC